MTESLGAVITEAVGVQVDPEKIRRFDRAVERKIGHAVDEADARAQRRALEELREKPQRPQPSEANLAMHRYVMECNTKPTGIMSFAEFRAARGL